MQETLEESLMAPTEYVESVLTRIGRRFMPLRSIGASTGTP